MSDRAPTSEYAQPAAEEANITYSKIEGGIKTLSNPAVDPEKNLGAAILTNLEEKHELIARNIEFEGLYKEVVEASKLDELTKLKSRKEILDTVEVLINSKRGFALLSVDADHFKLVNDEYGHQTGDLVLCVIARRMSSRISDTDSVGRVGGEEFMVLLPDISNLEVARDRADEIRRSLADHPVTLEGGAEIHQTLSIGAVLHEPGESAAVLIKRADRALYRAKILGRNRVVTEQDG